MPKLILGTASFGTGYGISNKGSYVESKDIFEIVSAAQTNGIDEFDTAPAYGFAESYLGLSLNQEFSPKVSSKVSKDHCESAELILRSIKNTIRNTKVQKISNLYLHDPEVLNSSKASETIAGLKEALASGLVERIGLSVYTLDSLLRAKDLFPELSVFQVPENICDRRMLNSKELMDLKCDDNVLIVRSIFLQGLLLMPLSEVPTKLNSARKLILELSSLAKANQITSLDVCLAYGQAISWASGIVVGAVNASQVIQIVESRIKLEDSWLTRIDTASLEILDPRRW